MAYYADKPIESGEKKKRKKENVTENSNRPNVYSRIFIKRAGFLFTVRSKKKTKHKKKTMHDSFPVLVVESIILKTSDSGYE